jgi:hypothetical protein
LRSPDRTSGCDFIYIDGSHIAKDVLTDRGAGVAAAEARRASGLRRLHVGRRSPGRKPNPLDNPRLAIDAFYNIHRREAVILPVHPAPVLADEGMSPIIGTPTRYEIKEGGADHPG